MSGTLFCKVKFDNINIKKYKTYTTCMSITELTIYHYVKRFVGQLNKPHKNKSSESWFSKQYFQDLIK